MTVQAIEQVEGEFRARRLGVTLSKATINQYMHLNMIGTSPFFGGYDGFLPLHVFKLLVLVAESFIQINQVNSDVVPWQKIIMQVNQLCDLLQTMN
jgi:hypothetical protein